MKGRSCVGGKKKPGYCSLSLKKGGEGDGKLKWNLVAGFYVFVGFVYVYFFMVVVDLFCYSCI